ncbi:MAG TPA: hypothetical protein VNK50_13070 [Calidithermus sp.]|nr:hypothetical protein [Calidithermus sp.]
MSDPETATPAAGAESAPAAAAAPAPPPGPGPAEDWRAALPEELRRDKSLESFRDIAALAKSYIETKRLVGASVRLPGPEAKPEEWEAFWGRLGRPAEPAQYLAQGVKLPELPAETGLSWSPGDVDRFLGAAHRAGLTPRQVQAVLDFYAEYSLGLTDRARAEQAQQEQQRRRQLVAELEKRWGPQGGPLWRQQLSRADAALDELLDGAPAEVRQRIVDLVNQEPELAEALARIGEGLISRGFVSGDELPAGLSVTDIDAKIAAIRNDPRHVWHRPGAPGWEEANEQMMQLFRLREAALRRQQQVAGAA